MYRCARRVVGGIFVSFAASAGVARLLVAQGGGDELSARAPRFLAALSPKPVPVDISRTPILQRRIALDLRGATLAQALQAIGDSSGLRIAYSQAELPISRRVGLQAKDITVAAALTEVLLGLGVDAVFNRQGQAMLVRRDETRRPHLSGAIAGQVIDSQSRVGVSGAEVFLDGTRWRTMTDTSGRYRLGDVDTGQYMLTIRRLGYRKQSRPVAVREGQTDTADMALAPVATRLNELVTTATGQRRRLDIANDVTTINADSVMQTAPITSVTDLLEGRVPGLTVQRTSGAPGDPARLRLRGAASPLRNNDPIVIVDGVRVYAEQSAARSANLAGAGQYAAPSPLDYIDPNSIEKVEVLKGPSAATLYGQDAANGVIVITTKKGKAGPTRWNASLEHSRTRMEGDFPDLFLRWGHSITTDLRMYCPLGAEFFAIPCEGDSVASYQMLNDPALTVLDGGHRSALTLGASGGSGTLTYAVTGSFQDQLGLIKLPDYAADAYQARLGTVVPDWMRRPQHFKQWGVTSQLSTRIGTAAELSLTTNLSRQTQQRSSLETQLQSLMQTYFDRATGTYYAGTQQILDGRVLKGITTTTSDVLTSYYQRVTDGATQFTNGLNFSWRPRHWLNVNADAGLNIVQRGDESWLPHGASSADTSGFVNMGKGASLLSTVNLRGDATAPLGHGFIFRFAAGANYAGTSIDDQTLQTRNVPLGQSLSGSTVTGGNRTLRDDATFGWYVEPSVGNSKFDITTGLRLDGGSNYGGGLSGFHLPKFPKLGFTYLVSDESWFPFKALFQSLRVRLAYGKASRQPGLTERLRVYSTTDALWTNGAFGDAVFLKSLGNTQLRPERTTEFEGGFDADLLDNRLTLIVTGYRKTTDDALLPVPVAPSVYGENVSVTRNIGVIRNTGLEFTLGAQLLRRGPLTWSTQLDVSQNHSLVVRLGPGVEPFYMEGLGSTEGASRVVPGYPLFGRWATPVVGYADANGNGVLEFGEVVLGDTAVYVGLTEPNYTANLHTTIGLWRNAVTIAAGFRYEDGLSQQNAGQRALAPFARGSNDPAASLADQVAVLGVAPTYFETQTVNTLRFNDLAVTYSLPGGLTRRLGAQALRVSLQGSNLGLWTNYQGLDPNVNSFATGNNLRGGAILPQPRSWQVRVNATY